MEEKILLVEDEEKLARMVELELRYEGYQVDKSFDGRSGLERALSGEYDLVLLDIMLPQLSGMEVLRRLRKEGVQLPVIMLTARDSVVDKVSGLDSGADDYITKPFAIEELLARIRAALRKRGSGERPEEPLLSAGPLTMDVERHTVAVSGTPVELTRREFDLLRYLLENKEKVISRESLLDHVWGFDFVGETNAVDVYIRFLRSKIDERFDIKLIHTVRGVGYVIREDGNGCRLRAGSAGPILRRPHGCGPAFTGKEGPDHGHQRHRIHQRHRLYRPLRRPAGRADPPAGLRAGSGRDRAFQARPRALFGLAVRRRDQRAEKGRRTL